MSLKKFIACEAERSQAVIVGAARRLIAAGHGDIVARELVRNLNVIIGRRVLRRLCSFYMCEDSTMFPGSRTLEQIWRTMKGTKNSEAVSTIEFCEYNIKCFVGAAIGYSLYVAFPQHSRQFLWMLVSILLSITHDNDSKMAFDRMKGNIIGSTVGLFVFLLHNPPNLATICIGIAVAIAICFRLKLIGVSRTTLVAFIIVLFYEEANSSWHGAAYRMASVVSGCLIGLIINYIFRKLAIAFHLPVSTPVADGIKKEEKQAAKAGEE